MSLQIKNLMFSFKKDIFIKDLNFEICRNQIGLVGGASGVGKSTLLNVISGLKKSDSGSIICNGQILNEEKKFVLPEKRNIGYVFQDFALFPHISAEKNIKYAIHKEYLSFYDEVINSLNLEDHIKKMPYQLSGGQQQRVAIARAILIKPQLLLLDEPFSNLDKKNVELAEQLIIKVIEDLNIPCLIVTHNLGSSNLISKSKEINLT
tara:strand:+ start:626 stop:1246 length:621 start_codon:yes stop_codon:yes gene_type:complete